jgi:hypothetical protein
MGVKLHRDGKLRGWLGARFGGDAELGDRVWRRCLHLFGAAVLLYYVLPPGFFIVLPNWAVLLLALAMVLGLEGMCHRAGWELPTLRPFERARVASYAWYAVALVVAVLAFPEPVAVVVVLGTAIVDPVAGEARSARRGAMYPGVPLIVYAAIAVVVLGPVFRWEWGGVLLAAGLSTILGVVAEYPKSPIVDDDVTMTLLPGVALTVLLHAAPWLPALPP